MHIYKLYILKLLSIRCFNYIYEYSLDMYAFLLYQYLYCLHKRMAVLSLFLALYTDTLQNSEQFLKSVCSYGELLHPAFRQVLYICLLFQLSKPCKASQVRLY